MAETNPDCILDECRFIDPEHEEWGYVVVCLNSGHADQECPAEHEMFRLPRAENGAYGDFGLSRLAAQGIHHVAQTRPLEPVLSREATVSEPASRLRRLAKGIGQLFSGRSRSNG